SRAGLDSADMTSLARAVLLALVASGSLARGVGSARTHARREENHLLSAHGSNQTRTEGETHGYRRFRQRLEWLVGADPLRRGWAVHHHFGHGRRGADRVQHPGLLLATPSWRWHERHGEPGDATHPGRHPRLPRCGHPDPAVVRPDGGERTRRGGRHLDRLTHRAAAPAPQSPSPARKEVSTRCLKTPFEPRTCSH